MNTNDLLSILRLVLTMALCFLEEVIRRRG